MKNAVFLLVCLLLAMVIAEPRAQQGRGGGGQAAAASARTQPNGTLTPKTPRPDGRGGASRLRRTEGSCTTRESKC